MISFSPGPVDSNVNGMPASFSACRTKSFTLSESLSQSVAPLHAGSMRSRPVTAAWVAPLIMAE